MNWEFSFLYFLQELHNPILDKIMVFITKLGNGGLLWIGLAVIMMCFKKYRKCAISIGIALVFKELFWEYDFKGADYAGTTLLD